MVVGVLICTYANDINAYLSDMFMSIFSSELPNDIELRVFLHIDGPISEEKENVIADYPVYKIVRSEKSIGLARGLNKIINELTIEKYIFRMDADDLMLPDRMIRQIEFLEANQDVDFCGGAIQEFVGSTMNVVNRCVYPANNEGVIKQLTRSSPFAHVTVCFRLEFFRKYGEYPIDYPLNEDIAYWIRVLKSGAKGANLMDDLVLVRMDDAYSRRTFQKAVHEFRAFMSAAFWLKKDFHFPFLRFLLRLCPEILVKALYQSKIRNIVLRRKV